MCWQMYSSSERKASRRSEGKQGREVPERRGKKSAGEGNAGAKAEGGAVRSFSRPEHRLPRRVTNKLVK